jgi:hypothetical protein
VTTEKQRCRCDERSDEAIQNQAFTLPRRQQNFGLVQSFWKLEGSVLDRHAISWLAMTAVGGLQRYSLSQRSFHRRGE